MRDSRSWNNLLSGGRSLVALQKCVEPKLMIFEGISIFSEMLIASNMNTFLLRDLSTNILRTCTYIHKGYNFVKNKHTQTCVHRRRRRYIPSSGHSIIWKFEFISRTFEQLRLHNTNTYTTRTQCGIDRNLLSQFFDKNFVKLMFSLKSWFHEKIMVRVNFSFFHIVLTVEEMYVSFWPGIVIIYLVNLMISKSSSRFRNIWQWAHLSYPWAKWLKIAGQLIGKQLKYWTFGIYFWSKIHNFMAIILLSWILKKIT